MRTLRSFAPVLLFSLAPLALSAQTTIPPNSPQASHFKDTSILKPPAGQKVAIIEFEDLECPVCARAFPIVHQAANHYHVPIEEYDFQIPYHQWSHEAASFALYLKEKVSPELSEEYRREVFASQQKINSKDDLKNFTQQFMTAHGKQMPFVLDPSYGKQVDESTNLGMRMGVMHTPTIVVVTPTHWIEVVDPMDLYAALDQAEAEVGHGAAHK
jgi:protein-disulfide isomerase